MNEKNPVGRPVKPDDQKATSHLHIRTTRERKGAYVRASRPGKLSDWAIGHLDKASGYKPK